MTAPVQTEETGGIPVPSPPVLPVRQHAGWFVAGHDPRRNQFNKTGMGRPSSAIRAAARLAYAQRIELLCHIADGEPLPFKRRYLARAGRKLPDGTICTEEQEAEGLVIEVQWEESADLDQRMKAVEMLGRVGLPSATTPDDPATNPATLKPVYEITFD